MIIVFISIYLKMLKVLKAIQQFEKMNINGADSSFQFDYLSSSLSILERRINTAVLHLISKVVKKFIIFVICYYTTFIYKVLI